MFYRTLVVVLLSLSLPVAMAAVAGSSDGPDTSRVWSGQAWNFRYVLKLDAPSFFDIRETRGKKKLAIANPAQEQEIEAVAHGVRTYVVENDLLEREEVLATLLLEFNKAGELVSKYDWPRPLVGHLNLSGEIVLATGNADTDLLFGIAQWQQGNGSGARSYSPALCNSDDDVRYRPEFKPGSVIGSFGCREWSYYLRNNKLPYIDVTSWQFEEDRQAHRDHKGHYPVRALASIRPVIGWGRFDIAPKPVIGRHGKSWFCLHECPDGDLPGFIPNISNWAARNGWPVPKPPKRMPLFADSAAS